MSLGGDAEAKKSKKANFFTTFEILKFAQSDKVSTNPIQQFTLPGGPWIIANGKLLIEFSTADF